ncbi:MAG: hypothetical protein SF339_19585 [Blastocatellia bacterium]|nr:hypothetical protein [Blastocatellia bacterium]
MKYLAPLCLAIAITLVSAGAGMAQTRPEAGVNEILTNESVINLSRAGFKDRTIIMLIRSSETRFDISTPRLVELKKRGVKEQVITAMIERTNMGIAAQRMPSLRDDEFFAKDDDAFFNGPIFKQLPTEKEAKRREDEAMIFGSQSGSKSATQSRGTGPNVSGSSQGEVMGSASVRIVRPPSEAGGEPKLQRAAKLDNQGVLEMIQAGFSEGTILRKIESSQVDFDLSQKAVSNLRQNRATERIIRAMTTAMEESK